MKNIFFQTSQMHPFTFVDIKIIDWQTFSGAHPLVDIAHIVLYNTCPDLIEDNLDEMLESYFYNFARVVQHLKIQPPFTLEELQRDFDDKAYALIFCAIVFFYEAFRKRKTGIETIYCILQKSFLHHPCFHLLVHLLP